MAYTYAEKKQAEKPAAIRESTTQGPSLEALRSGAAVPTRAQLGRRVDLPDAMREKMEASFGADLSAVRLYESETVADAGAKAVTRGSDIAFAPGMLDFTSFGGQALLGHELSHVVTQARGEVTGGGFLNDHALEARADREGAMAAAGQTVAAPVSAMSGVSAAAAAGPMQAALGKKDKEEPAPSPAPAPVPVPPAAKPKQDYSKPAGVMNSIEQTGEQLKKGNIAGTSSVMSVGTAGGSEAVVKMKVTPELEMAAADLINIAGKTMTEKHGGSWSLDAPSARTPLQEEIPNMDEAIKSGKLRGMYADEYAKDATLDDIADMERKNAVVYPMVGGSKRYDPDWDRKEIEEKIAEGKKPVVANPENETERNDFFRTMGHASLLDIVIGNYDRMVGRENFENWLEDQDSRQLHLIDNDSPGDYGLRRTTVGADKKSNWLTWLMEYVGTTGDVKRSSSLAFDTIKQKNNTATQYMGAETAKGIEQATEALPEMRQKLMDRYKQRNGNKDMDEFQADILDRMQITHEAMTDKDMAAVYMQLVTNGLGLNPKSGESAADADRRQKLLAERDRLRRLKDLRSRKAVNLSLDND